MKTRKLLAPASAACAVLMAAASLTAAAADANQPRYPAFERLDVNQDGYISRGETARLQDFGRAFSEADDNHDGRLDRDEFVKAQSIHDRILAANYFEDSVITARVKSALVRDPEIKALEVSVETSRGVVLLSGVVDNERQIRRARQAAAAVEGVKGVRSHLSVKG